MSGQTPGPDEQEPYAGPHRGLATNYFSPSHIDSPRGLIIAGIIFIIGGPVIGGVIYAVSPEPKSPGLPLISVAFALVFALIGVVALTVGLRRRAWRRAHGIPVNAKPFRRTE
ncbi:MAG: hypothetical protein ABI083_06845 [Lapillicoccus sp.]